MLFNSIHFLIFLPLVLLLYYAVSQRYKLIIILLASLYFYWSFKPEYSIILFFSIILNYFVALYINKNRSSRINKLLAILAISFNLLILISFKYFNFLSDSTRHFLTLFSFKPDILLINFALPIGLSFYTFQNIGYIIDIYRKKVNPEKNFFIFGAYVLFFPKFISGPIERAQSLLPQFHEKNRFELDNLIQGIKRIIMGLFKKVVIADRSSIVVSLIYTNPSAYSGLTLIIATLFFGFQLYADFSGYSDIAIGSAKMLGYNLKENFKRPFLSRSVSEFWRRWHISLSSWFQDYIFVPLYLRVSKLKRFSKLNSNKKHIISFIISIMMGEVLLGLWHGANWTFVFFGLFYGIAISAYYLIRNYWDKMNKYMQIIATFILINIGWIFFRANSISDSFNIFNKLFTDFSYAFFKINLGVDWNEIIIIVISLIIFILIEIYQEYCESKDKSFISSDKGAFVFYWLLLMGILLFGMFKKIQFIYAQF